MCRLALFNTEWINEIEQDDLVGLFEELDRKNGGHGVGITLCYAKTNPVTYKGVSLSPENLALITYGERVNPDLRYVVYHTRLASSGDIVDEQCHPFSQGTLYGLTIAHNGVVSSLSGSQTHSDTFMLYQLLTQYNLPLANLSTYFSGVFIGVYNKLPFVIKSSDWSELDLAFTDDYKAWCFCSNFYHYRSLMHKKMILKKSLGTFSWTNTLTDQKITSMLPVKYVQSYNKETKFSTTSQIKKRSWNNVTTWHDKSCNDWYCDGCAYQS